MDSKTLHKIGYGLYVISSKIGESYNGQIANTVFQITSKPPTIAVSINKDNFTYSFINESKIFSVSILSKNTPMKFIGLFGFKSGRDIYKFKDTGYKIGMTGSPVVLDNSIGYMEAKVIDSLDVGTHVLFVGEVVDAQILNDDEPMTYAYYHEIKGGKSPKTAPTYIEENKS
ncbi:MAG TPA: flavin reductase family protein [Desulfobacteraceae bacterium]|nr:flavin reductase family protein [Desulfobacteraceae bacterium]HPJ68467.1 flavin reductase family protein [Desulfobacteraceae bacterium]HPQ28068.1 flavin reductase family protein [Desulfobacteraceae bacterium]